MFDHPPVCLDVHKDMKQVWTIPLRTRLELNGPCLWSTEII